MLTTVAIILSLIYHFSFITTAYNLTDENKLIDYLMKRKGGGYKSHELPASTVNVNVFFRIKHITALNESQQTMTVNGAFYLRWTDPRLRWNPQEYKGIKNLDVKRLKNGQIWRPDARFFNPGEGAKWDRNANTRNEKLRYHGVVWDWAGSQFTVTATCHFDFSDFPKDKQTCALVFYSYNTLDQVKFDSQRFDFRLTPKDWSIRVMEQKPLRSGNFIITNNGKIVQKYLTPGGVATNSSIYPASITIQMLELQLEFQRIASYFGVTVLLPIVLTNIFTVATFLIDSKSLVLGTLMSALFFHGLFHDDFIKVMPPTIGDPPKIVYYYGISISITFLALVLRIFSSLHYSQEKSKSSLSDTERSAESILNLGLFCVYAVVFALISFSLLL